MKQRMHKKYILLITIVILATTGCWNYRELNDMAIVGSVGIDYNKEKDIFEVSAQILNAKKSSTGGGSSSGSSQPSPIIVYESKAKTIHEALRNMIFESPKKLYIGHLQLIIFGEDLAKKHLAESIDFFLRDAESRKEIHIILAKEGKASDVLKVLTPLEDLPASSLTDSIRTVADYKGSVNDTTFDEFLSQIYGDGIEAVIPTVIIEGKVKEGETSKNTSKTEADTVLKIDNLGIFKGYKLVGYLDQEESIGYNILLNNLGASVISFPCDDSGNYGSIEVVKSSSKISASVDDSKPKFDIKVSTEATLSEYDCKDNLRDNDVINEITKKASSKIKAMVKKTIEAAQKKYNTDIIGFGEQLYLNQNSYWKKNKKEWKTIFPNAKYNIKVNLKIPKKGSTINSAKEG